MTQPCTGNIIWDYILTFTRTAILCQFVPLSAAAVALPALRVGKACVVASTIVHGAMVGRADGC